MLITLWALIACLAVIARAQDHQLVLAAGDIYPMEKRLVLSGEDKLLIVDPNESDTANLKIVWQWTLADSRRTMPANIYKYFVSMDEAVPVQKNQELLCCSSSGGTALIRISSKTCQFYAATPMAHSACLLPGNKIAVALSTHKAGNAIEIYDINYSNQCLYRDSLYFAHGVVWMSTEKRLYALGYDSIRQYRLEGDSTMTPKLVRTGSWVLPGTGGHNLSYVDDHTLLVTYIRNVRLFDTKTHTFSTFAPLQGQANVKSANYDPITRHLIYTQAETGFWTTHIRSVHPDWYLTVPDLKLYKVRVFE